MKNIVLFLFFTIFLVGCSDNLVNPVSSMNNNDGSYYYYEIYQDFDPGYLQRALIIHGNSFTTLDSLHLGGYYTIGFQITFDTDGIISIGDQSFSRQGTEHLKVFCNRSYKVELK